MNHENEMFWKLLEGLTFSTLVVLGVFLSFTSCKVCKLEVFFEFNVDVSDFDWSLATVWDHLVMLSSDLAC